MWTAENRHRYDRSKLHYPQIVRGCRVFFA
jgi:hypothetical protein